MSTESIVHINKTEYARLWRRHDTIYIVEADQLMGLRYVAGHIMSPCYTFQVINDKRFQQAVLRHCINYTTDDTHTHH